MKIDFKSEFKAFYGPSIERAELVEMAPMKFLALNGTGEPVRENYQEAVRTLYGVGYCIRIERRHKKIIPDYNLGPLEGLWAEEGGFTAGSRENMPWTLILWQPDFVTAEDVKMGAEKFRQKKPNPQIDKLELITLDEGLAAQILHIGPYSTERPSLAKLHVYIREQGLTPRGRYHEIYLDDPRRTPPDRIRTILRQPVSRA